MAEFETIAVPGTAAEKAVNYIMQRVVNDRDFSWYMFGTQALRLCIQAEAERLGMSEEQCELNLNERYKQASPRLERHGCGTTRVVLLEKQMEKTVERISELLDEDEIQDSVAEELTQLLERY